MQDDVQHTTENTKTRAEVRCPYCTSTDTELFSLFGQQLLTVQYYCNACRTPFEYVKDDDVLDGYLDIERRTENFEEK